MSELTRYVLITGLGGQMEPHPDGAFVVYEDVVAEIERLRAAVDWLQERLWHYEPKPNHCEHGILDGDWCEGCNRAYKESAEAAKEGGVMNALERKCLSCLSGVQDGGVVRCVHQFHPGVMGGCGTEWVEYCHDYQKIHGD